MQKALLQILIVYVVVSSSSPTVAANSLPRFQSLTIEEGLPDRTVWSIAQDETGLIWLGTSKGLASFNGIDYKIFRNTDFRKKSLQANVIRSIFVDKNNTIYVGSYAGLGKFNPLNENIEKISFNIGKNNELSELFVFAIYKDKNGVIWLGTNLGLFGLNENASKLIYSNQNNNNFVEFPVTKINAILETTTGELLIGSDKGLHILSKDRRTITMAKTIANKTIDFRVNTLLQKKDNSLLIGTTNGLYASKKKSYMFRLANDILADINIVSMVKDERETLWLGTVDEGIYTLDANNSIRNYKYETGSDYSLSDNDVYSLMIDNSGILWAGTFNNGINWLDPITLNFNLLDDSKASLYCLKSPVIYSLYQNNPNTLWLGTQNGLAMIDSDNSSCSLYTQNQESDIILSGKEIRSIIPHPVNSNLLYLSTYNGVDTLDINKMRIVSSPALFPKSSIIDSLVLNKDEIYLATNKGLFKQTNNQTNLDKVRSKNKGLEQTLFFQVVVNSKNIIYLASWKGLLTIGKNGLIKPISWSNREFLENPIRALFIDKEDTIWVGIDNVGLFHFHSDGRLISKFVDAKKLPAIDGFSSLSESPNGDLWVSSTKGISHLSKETNIIVNYRLTDGLPSESYTHGAKFISPTGNFFLGNRKGVTRFDPKKIRRNEHSPSVILTDFLYFNEILKLGTKIKKFELSKPISQLKQINLTYKDYVFGFEFAALHYADPNRNRYAYKMKNYDENWNFTSAKFRRATYSNMPAGNYVFKVKASNNHGVWSDEPKTIRVNISPPPWATPWAYALYLCLVFISLYSFVKYRTAALERRSRELEISVTERTRELAMEKGKVEQLLSRKNEEFANVSHEFRTPLTLILGPISQLLKTNKKNEETNKLNIVQRNGYRLLRMVDQLLNLETFRIKTITQKTPQPISKTIHLLAEAFADIAKEKNILLSISNIDEINFEFTPDALGKIILNLLSNAVKYTKPGGSITIQANRTQKNHYTIQIEDSGIGIPKDKQRTIFDRYNRVLDENSEQVTGAGIGLALVKSLVEFHQGHISLESKLGEGSTFNISLPIIGEVALGEIDTHKNDEIIAMELLSLTNQSTSPIDDSDQVKGVIESNFPKLLVIEDNLDMCEYIVSCVSNDYQVYTAADGLQGMQTAQSEIPDLIISDIMMPKMDGYEVTRALRENQLTNHIPIILLTARGDRESRLKGWHEKADEYLTKPFDIEELQIRLKNLLAIRDILKKRFSETTFSRLGKSVATETPSQTSLKENLRNSDVGSDKNQLQSEFINRLNESLESLFAESSTSVADIANALSIGERQLFRKLKSTLDMTPADYLRRFRLEKSKPILQEGRSASYAAFEVGFSSQSYYGKCFAAQFGLSPSEFKKRLN